MKKEAEKTYDNSFGIAAVILGIFSILFAYPPLYGLTLGVISLIFAGKQQKIMRNNWSRNGRTLALIGIILSIAFAIFLVWLKANPDVLNGALQNAIY